MDDGSASGESYENGLSLDDRRTSGQYYTPGPIVDLICRLTILHHNDIVLDPACGSGAFLIGAYQALKALKIMENIPQDHNSLLPQLIGNDVNPIPCQLAKRALASQDQVKLIQPMQVSNFDFFEFSLDHPVDVVVMNPPYLTPAKFSKHIVQKHLRGGAISRVLDESPTLQMDGKSDLYCYFITHAWDFLAEGGRLGAVVSDRFLDTEYGAAFQKILLRLFKIEAVISLERQAFKEPLIGTALLILEKCGDPRDRANHVVQFLQVKARKTVEEIIALLEDDPPTNVDQPDYRLNALRQEILGHHPSWSNFLFHDFSLIALFKVNDHLKHLSCYTEVAYGLKSGANEFFFRKWAELTPELRVFFTPLLKAIGQIGKVQYHEDFPEWGVLDIRGVMSKILNQPENGATFSQFDQEVTQFINSHPKNKEIIARLPGIGNDIARLKGKKMQERLRVELRRSHPIKEILAQAFPVLQSYVELGETRGFYLNPSVINRPFWFCLEYLRPYDICLSYFYWRFFLNPVKTNLGYVASNNFLPLYFTRATRGYEAVLAAWLNSNLIQFFIETGAARAKGERLDRIQMKTYQARNLPCPDFSRISASQIQMINALWQEFLAIDEAVDLNQPEPDPAQVQAREAWFAKRKEIDQTFLSFLFPPDLLDFSTEWELAEEPDVFIQKCREIYQKLRLEFQENYSPQTHAEFLNYLLTRVTAANAEMVRSRERGGGEQQDSQVQPGDLRFNLVD